MQKIVVASKNPVKIEAVRRGFLSLFPDQAFHVEAVSTPSGVSDQPMSDLETLTGALNRAKNARSLTPEADYWVGVEGGVAQMENDLAVFAWIVIQTNELTGKSRTGTFFLPKTIADLVRQGLELGDADDIVFQSQNSKQQNGAIGLLTDNVIDRIKLYQHAVILALVPFKNKSLYQPE